jgi:hypothetical protein
MLTRIVLALLSIAVRTMRHTRPYQEVGSPSTAPLPAGFPLPVPGAPGARSGLRSSFVI